MFFMGSGSRFLEHVELTTLKYHKESSSSSLPVPHKQESDMFEIEWGCSKKSLHKPAPKMLRLLRNSVISLLDFSVRRDHNSEWALLDSVRQICDMKAL